jgi:small subunit ribosomal protein S13|tara:strand:+ start:536 stop:892 length:357 start_codon:yes stop_codon:yes gene_type:complete
MVIFLQKKLSNNKKAPFALCKLYGVGLSYSLYLCKKVGLNFNRSLNYVDSSDLRIWRRLLSEERIVSRSLKRLELYNIKKQMVLRSYRGVRHFEGMPVHGQNTKSNARTAKKLLGLKK